MPKNPNYSKSIIYKLCCKNPIINKIYIGSTTNFRLRKNYHKTSFKNDKIKDYYSYKYQFIRENGGFDNWDMIMIQEYPCNSKKELETRERFWIEELQAELNSSIPTRTPKEWNEKNKDKMKEYHKEYREKNKEKIKETNKKKYYENYKNKMQTDLEYREKRLKQKRDQYFNQKNK